MFEASRFSFEGRRLRVFEGFCWISWAQDWRWRFACDAWNSGSNCKSTRTSKHPGTPFIPGIVKLLWKVCAESLHNGSPFELSFAAQQEVEMVTGMLTGIFTSKASSLISLYLGTLRPQFASNSGWWHLYLWNWSCDLPQISWQHWETNCFCLPFSFSKWTKLFTNWERSSLSHLWSQEVPYVPVW